MQKLIATNLIVVAVLAIGGCSPEKISEMELPIPDEPNLQELSENTSTLKVETSEVSVSPAAAHFQMPDINTPADEVCRQFIELLNQGDSNRFELLLTPAALNVSNKLRFSLPPLGEVGAEIKTSDPQFGTLREKLCFVDCTIRDSELSEITMMLRNSKQGWRIAGMMVHGEDSETKNLLSFENLTDVTQIRDSLAVSVEEN